MASANCRGQDREADNGAKRQLQLAADACARGLREQGPTPCGVTRRTAVGCLIAVTWQVVPRCCHVNGIDLVV